MLPYLNLTYHESMEAHSAHIIDRALEKSGGQSDEGSGVSGPAANVSGAIDQAAKTHRRRSNQPGG